MGCLPEIAWNRDTSSVSEIAYNSRDTYGVSEIECIRVIHGVYEILWCIRYIYGVEVIVMVYKE